MGNVSQDLDAWLVSHVEETSNKSTSDHPSGEEPSTNREDLEAQMAFLVPETDPEGASNRASEPEPEARFCDEVIFGSAVHRAKAHFRAMLSSVLALSAGLAIVAGYEISHHLGATTASYQAPVPTASLRPGLGLSGSYVAAQSGQFPILLSIRQDGRELFGSFTTSRLDQASSPESVIHQSSDVTGFVTKTGFELVIHSLPVQTVNGSVSGTSLVLRMPDSAISFDKGTKSNFSTLSEREFSFVLDNADHVSDQTAQFDLVVATDKAEGYGFVHEGDFSGISEFGVLTTTLRWTTGSCRATSCVSYRIVDAESAGDKRGVVLATFSAASGDCYYAAVLLGNPVGITNDASAFGDSNSSVTRLGTYFAETTSTSCSASTFLGSSSSIAWSSSVP